MLCFVYLPGVSWLLCGSSSRYHGFVCSLWLWYFLIILTYYFVGLSYSLSYIYGWGNVGMVSYITKLFLGRLPWVSFNSIWWPFFRQYLTTCSSWAIILHERMCISLGLISCSLANKDSLLTELPHLVGCHWNHAFFILGPVAQLVESPTIDPGIANSIPAWSHTFVEIDHEIIFTVILLFPLIQEGLVSVTSESMCTKYWLTA